MKEEVKDVSTIPQAMAFFNAVLSKGVLIHLEAILGRGEVPTISDFDSQNPDQLDKVRGLLGYFKEQTGIVEAMLSSRPIQKRIPEEPGPGGGPVIPEDTDGSTTFEKEDGRSLGEIPPVVDISTEAPPKKKRSHHKKK